jgi:hypothetical protein
MIWDMGLKLHSASLFDEGMLFPAGWAVSRWVYGWAWGVLWDEHAWKFSGCLGRGLGSMCGVIFEFHSMILVYTFKVILGNMDVGVNTHIERLLKSGRAVRLDNQSNDAKKYSTKEG